MILNTKNVINGGFVLENIVNILRKRGLRSKDEIGWLNKRDIGVLLHNTGTEGARHFTEVVRNMISHKHHFPDCSFFTYPSESLDIMADISISRNEQRYDFQEPSSVSINYENRVNTALGLMASNVSKDETFFSRMSKGMIYWDLPQFYKL